MKRSGNIIKNIDTVSIELELLKVEYDIIKKKIKAFENIIRHKLINEIIQERELFVLYKTIKKAKKAKRLDQKKRGKNYFNKENIKHILRVNIPIESKDSIKEKKSLYREAMFHVHPDKFSMDVPKLDTATKLTTDLIDIYKNGSLNDMQQFHSYVFSVSDVGTLAYKGVDFLNIQKACSEEIKEIKSKIKILKSRRVYFVLENYTDPLIFISELKKYYDDRIYKLLKRTRKYK